MRIVLASLLLTGCGTVTACSNMPVDPTPTYSESNRFAVEMGNNCNLTQSSIGLSGCAFKTGKLSGNLTFPAFYDGNLSLTSSQCNSLATPTNAIMDNSFNIAGMYNAQNGLSCSFQVNRTVTSKDVTLDNIMMGRFFVMMIPNSPYYEPLKFSIGENKFSGVGWYQKKTDKDKLYSDVVLSVMPTGNRGQIRVDCDTQPFMLHEYNSKPVQLVFQSDGSCDYAITATNYDNRFIELGTYIHEVQKPTIDITPPVVKVSDKKIRFTFTDLDVTGKIPVVLAVKIDTNKPCINTNTCTAVLNKDLYTVRAVTPNGRFIKLTYRVSTKTTEVIK